MLRTIIHGKIVIPSGVIDGSVIVAKNRISHIIEDDNYILVQTDQQDVEIIDADGCYIMPGLVDFHADMLEHAIQPRRKVYFPLNRALYSIQAQLLTTVFILFEEGMGLHEATSYASLYPARAVGLSDRIGSLEVGKEADIIVVRHSQGEIPLVEKTMVAGKWTFSK